MALVHYGSIVLPVGLFLYGDPPPIQPPRLREHTAWLVDDR
jgi:hypothetical protein